MLSAIIQNTEAQSTRSFRPRTLSVISVPLCFKSFLAEKMEGLTRELATQFHESEKLQSAIRETERCLQPCLPWKGKVATRIACLNERKAIQSYFTFGKAA